MIFALFSSSGLGTSWGWPIGAAIGGIVVFVGLLLERMAEWKSEKYIVKPGRLLSDWGWRILMLGIALEIGIGFAMAWKDEKDIDAAKTAWRGQRIYAFEATAILVVRPLKPVEDFASLPKAPPDALTFPPQAESPKKEDNLIFLNLGRSGDMAKGAYSKENAEIQADEAYRSAVGDNLIRFDIHFGGHHENFFENRVGNTLEFFNDSLTPEDLDAIDLVLPFRCEVISGEIKMEIDNGLTNMDFQIPAQKTFVCAATSIATNGTFVPIDFSPEIRTKVAKSDEVEREKAEAQAKFISRGIELEAKAHEGKSNDRTILDEQKDLFIKLLREYPKTPVKVFVTAGDDEAGRYAQKVRQLLDAAKYGGDGAGIITNSNIIMEGTNSEAWKSSSNMLAFLVYGDPRAPFFVMARSPIAGVSWGFSGIGLNGIYIPDNTVLKPGEVGVVVPPKPK